MRSKPPCLVELVQLLYRHVLLGAGQRVAEVAVQPALQDRLGLGLIAGVTADRVVEGGSGVQHQSPQLPGPCSVHLARGIGQRVQSKGVGQASGRVDGDDTGPPALAGALDRHGCRSGGLANSPRAAADDDPALFDEGEQVVHDVHPCWRRRVRVPGFVPPVRSGRPDWPDRAAREGGAVRSPGRRRADRSRGGRSLR